MGLSPEMKKAQEAGWVNTIKNTNESDGLFGFRKRSQDSAKKFLSSMNSVQAQQSTPQLSSSDYKRVTGRSSSLLGG